MSSTEFSRTSNSAFVGIAGLLALLILSGCASLPGKLLYRDDFADLANWHIEAEKPGRITAANGVLDVEVPAGVTLARDYFTIRLIDLRTEVLGTPGATWAGTMIEPRPAVGWKTTQTG